VADAMTNESIDWLMTKYGLQYLKEAENAAKAVWRILYVMASRNNESNLV